MDSSSCLPAVVIMGGRELISLLCGGLGWWMVDRRLWNCRSIDGGGVVYLLFTISSMGHRRPFDRAFWLTPYLQILLPYCE